MLTALSALVALLCAGASLRRLRWAVAPTALDPILLGRVLSDANERANLPKLRDATAGERDLAWEHGLLSAFAAPDQSLRDAQANEQLTELDGLSDRWVRVPRVCASIATSAGFLFAAIYLLGAVAPAVSTGAMMSTLVPALDALAVGIAGTSFCAAVHMRARAARRRRRSATDRLVDALQTLAMRSDGAAGGPDRA